MQPVHVPDNLFIVHNISSVPINLINVAYMTGFIKTDHLYIVTKYLEIPVHIYAHFNLCQSHYALENTYLKL